MMLKHTGGEMIPKAALIAIAATLVLFNTAAASPFTSVVVYGDSLADNGNLFAATGYPPFPYSNGRSSNGPVAVERLAVLLNAPLIDFAWAGATTGIGNHLDNGTPTSIVALPGMRTTFEATRSSLTPFLDGLFVVWGGPNDFLSPAAGDITVDAIVNRAVTDILYLVHQLQGLGARNILVPGMPDLGLTPTYAAQGPLVAGGASAVSNAFNANLRSRLPSGTTYFDTASLLRSVVANPAAYGFNNVTAPCFTGFSVCATPDTYLFWDDFHPTAAGHAILAREFATAVPEPGSILIMVSGLVLLIAAKRSQS